MQNGRIISIIFVLVLSFIFVSAQTSKINFLNNKSNPFKDGETVIAEVKFAGLDSDYEQYEGAVYEKDFLRDLRERRLTISAGEKFSSQKVEKILKFLKEWLSARSYLKAEVIALGKKLPKQQMQLVFDIKKGTMVRVSEIRFVGNKNILSEEYVENMKWCLQDSWTIYDKRYYDFCASKEIRILMYSKGYFQAKLKRVMPRLVDDNYVVTIEVEEGVRFVLGDVKINGAKVFSEKEILEMLGQKTGDAADGKNINEFVYEKLKRVYADKGYILYDAEFEPEYIEPKAEGADATVNISINIDEGAQFKLSRISFTGVDKEKEQELKEILSLKEGGIYNQSKLEEGIEKINGLNEFYVIDKLGDVEIRIAEDSAAIDLVIKLNKIQK